MSWITLLVLIAVAILAVIIFFKITKLIFKIAFIILIIALGVYAFQHYYNPDALTPDTTTNETTLPNEQTLNQTDCDTLGGMYGPHGKAQTVFCNLPTKDSGKICTDDLDCEKLCIYNETSNSGNCQAYQHIYGCFTLMSNNTKGSTICID